MRESRQRRRRSEGGAAAVEFALVVLPLLLIIGGIINFGVAFANQISLDNAVRQAARAGVVDVTPAPNLSTIVNNEYRPIGVDRNPTVTTPLRSSCTDSVFGASLQVRATVRTDFLFPWPVPDAVLSDTIQLTSQAEFQCEFA